MECLQVVAAIIINNNKILCLQRAKSKNEHASYKFEFPGGKVENGESYEQALARELYEELGIKVTVRQSDFYMAVEHEYEEFKVLIHSYICHVTDRYFQRKEHISHCWLKPSELEDLDWLAADLPIVKRLAIDRFNTGLS